MTILTATGSFADAYLDQFEGEIASIRNLSETEFKAKINNSDTIIHNASTITSTDLDICLERNFDFTRFLVKELQTNNPLAHLVHISSMSVLSPTNDSLYDDVINMTPYTYSKYLAESYCRKTTLNTISFVRFSTLFYKDPTKDGLSKLIFDAVTKKKITIYNGGEAKRNFLPLEIAAQYVDKIARSRPTSKKIYNLAAPNATTFLDVVTILQKHLPNIEIEDKKLDGSFPVLSDFTMNTLDNIGQIDFSLEEYIVEYIEKLRA